MTRFLGMVVVAVPLLLSLAVPAHAGVTRYVNVADRTCGGRSPCSATIQGAVTDAQPGDVIRVQAGTYVEQVIIAGKNDTATATEAGRIVLEADPGTPAGSVVLRGAASQCTAGYAIQFHQSKFITVRGLTITGAGGAALALLGGNNQNQAIHIERNRIFGNGSASCSGGITVNQGNPDTVIVNNLIYGNGRQGILLLDATGGPHAIIGNTIHGNGWSGVSAGREHEVLLANNAITGNGTTAGSTGGRVGVSREAAIPANPAGIQLLGNLLCGNRLGEIGGPALDSTDSGNLTPSGAEGAGVGPSPGCGKVATLYANVAGLDQRAFTGDDDFTPAAGSPLIDRGLDPRTLGLPVALNPLFEADALVNGVRPQAGGPGTARFDIGAIERVAAGDVVAPAGSFVLPATTFVRAQVTVTVEFTDGAGITSVTLFVDGQPLTAELTPPAPAASITATGIWDTTGFGDGPHTLTARATDAAGNGTTLQKVAIVDNSPPSTLITGGPSGAIVDSSATFTFEGADNVSPPGSLTFAWRLDGGPFSAFSAATAAPLIALAGPHTFEVKARDQAGNEDATPAQRSFTVSPLDITIGEPLDGATASAGLVLVRGSVRGGGGDVGVTVNGLPAALHGAGFAVLLPVDATVNRITARATTGAGTTASAAIAIGVSGAPVPPAVLLASPATGGPPLTVYFSLIGPTPTTLVELDADGDGTVDFSGPSLDAVAFTYTRPGLYVARATAVGPSGGFAVPAVVQVVDRASLDALLQSRWAAFRTALRVGAVEAALDLVAADQRDDYRALLNAMASQLSNIDAILPDISFVDLSGRRAEYQMIRIEDGLRLSYLVMFALDTSGVWRIEFF